MTESYSYIDNQTFSSPSIVIFIYQWQMTISVEFGNTGVCVPDYGMPFLPYVINSFNDKVLCDLVYHYAVSDVIS